MTTTPLPSTERSPYSGQAADGTRPSVLASPRHRPGLYVAILLATILLGTGYKLRRDGLFSCEAGGYASDRYIAYCQAKAYGDYDYGAFWYGLEPSASAAATKANVLFLGDSRLQFGLSSNATSRWFSDHSLRFYLLGFAYTGNMAFAGPLLDKLHPQAKMYVINVDRYFIDTLVQPAQAVMRDSTTRPRYGEKRFWQLAHRELCSRASVICGHEAAFFRERSNGSWIQTGGNWTASTVAYSDTVNHSRLDDFVARGRSFVSRLPVSHDCILLTTIPKGAEALGWSTGTAKALASALGLPFVSPELTGLTTFDGSHLDRPSAERWSAAFMQAAGPQIQKCLGQPGV